MEEAAEVKEERRRDELLSEGSKVRSKGLACHHESAKTSLLSSSQTKATFARTSPSAVRRSSSTVSS